MLETICQCPLVFCQNAIVANFHPKNNKIKNIFILYTMRCDSLRLEIQSKIYTQHYSFDPMKKHHSNCIHPQVELNLLLRYISPFALKNEVANTYAFLRIQQFFNRQIVSGTLNIIKKTKTNISSNKQEEYKHLDKQTYKKTEMCLVYT